MRSLLRTVMALLIWAGDASASPVGKIWFDQRVGNSRPLVRVRIAGSAQAMLLDSGSSHHVWSLRAARRAGVALKPGEPVRDVDGRDYAGFAVAAAAALDELPLAPVALVSSDWIDRLQPHVAGAAHFDGVLSPQKLPPPGSALIMDLNAGELRVAPWPEALVFIERYPQLLADVAAKESGHFVVDVEVGAHYLQLVLDTGAPRSMLWVPRSIDLPRDAVGLIDKHLRVTAGEVSRALLVEERQPLQGEAGFADGLLGLDVLHDCALALDADRAVVRCATATDFAPPGGGLRHEVVRLGDADGPLLTKRANGSFHYEGEGLAADVFKDGTVRFYRRRGRDETLRTEREERRWLLDETRDLRIELSRQDSLTRSFDALPALLSWVWHDGSYSPAQRREIIFRIWDEAAEPDDRELGAAGAEARRMIAAFVRRELPAQSRDGFSDEELKQLNARRPKLIPFDPYRPPAHDDRVASP